MLSTHACTRRPPPPTPPAVRPRPLFTTAALSERDLSLGPGCFCLGSTETRTRRAPGAPAPAGLGDRPLRAGEGGVPASPRAQRSLPDPDGPVAALRARLLHEGPPLPSWPPLLWASWAPDFEPHQAHPGGQSAVVSSRLLTLKPKKSDDRIARDRAGPAGNYHLTFWLRPAWGDHKELFMQHRATSSASPPPWAAGPHEGRPQGV